MNECKVLLPVLHGWDEQPSQQIIWAFLWVHVVAGHWHPAPQTYCPPPALQHTRAFPQSAAIRCSAPWTAPPVFHCCCAPYTQPAHVSQGALGKLFLQTLSQAITIRSNSPFRPWIHRQCKESPLAWISDNKCTFFGLKRNPGRVIFCLWAQMKVLWNRTCSWSASSVEYLWLPGRVIKQ